MNSFPHMVTVYLIACAHLCKRHFVVLDIGDHYVIFLWDGLRFWFQGFSLDPQPLLLLLLLPEAGGELLPELLGLVGRRGGGQAGRGGGCGQGGRRRGGGRRCRPVDILPLEDGLVDTGEGRLEGEVQTEALGGRQSGGVGREATGAVTVA